MQQKPLKADKKATVRYYEKQYFYIFQQHVMFTHAKVLFACCYADLKNRSCRKHNSYTAQVSI